MKLASSPLLVWFQLSLLRILQHLAAWRCQVAHDYVTAPLHSIVRRRTRCRHGRPSRYSCAGVTHLTTISRKLIFSSELGSLIRCVSKSSTDENDCTADASMSHHLATCLDTQGSCTPTRTPALHIPVQMSAHASLQPSCRRAFPARAHRLLQKPLRPKPSSGPRAPYPASLLRLLACLPANMQGCRGGGAASWGAGSPVLAHAHMPRAKPTRTLSCMLNHAHVCVTHCYACTSELQCTESTWRAIRSSN
jgi:hypothetical protein